MCVPVCAVCVCVAMAGVRVCDFRCDFLCGTRVPAKKNETHSTLSVTTVDDADNGPVAITMNERHPECGYEAKVNCNCKS